jgi:hypothetical protein
LIAPQSPLLYFFLHLFIVDALDATTLPIQYKAASITQQSLTTKNLSRCQTTTSPTTILHPTQTSPAALNGRTLKSKAAQRSKAGVLMRPNTKKMASVEKITSIVYSVGNFILMIMKFAHIAEDLTLNISVVRVAGGYFNGDT